MSLPPEVDDFLHLVRHGQVNNTYKMVWAKAIVDLCLENPERVEMHLVEIAEKIFASYWNLHVFFDPEGETLRQGSNSAKSPVVLQTVLQAMKQYRERCQDKFKPLLFEQIPEGSVQVDLLKIVFTLQKDVSHRFLNRAVGGASNLYAYDAEKRRIAFKEGTSKNIAAHAAVLAEAISYRWTQILEDFNRTTPRIASKVRMQREGSFHRKSLKPFAEWLLISNPDRKCFQCGEIIQEKSELTIDHMIPWSFLFSDDLWNLAFVHAACNSKKSARPPTKGEIDELDSRNRELEALLRNSHSEMHSKKAFKDLCFANEHGLLRKMWMLCVNP